MNIRNLKQALADFVVSPTRTTLQTIDGLQEMIDEAVMFIEYLQQPQPEIEMSIPLGRIPHTSFAE